VKIDYNYQISRISFLVFIKALTKVVATNISESFIILRK
jgi:hypothetical protein